MSMTLKINDINCSYGSHDVIKGLSYDFPEGSFIGIIGPNGSGKSTLLHAMARTLQPEKGVVFLGKENIYKIPPKQVAKTVAVVPQNTNVSFNFTVHEIVMMGRNPYLSRFGWEKKHDLDIIDRSLEATATSDLRDKFIGDLSGGERQRVIISRALAQEPEILLLDEPTSHLDITHQLETLQLLQDLNTKENLTVIIVLHDLNLAAQYCKGLILLNEGKIFSAGPVDDVLQEDNIKKVYNTDVIISKHPIWDVPSITLLPKKINEKFQDTHIHLVCGGGSGKDFIWGLVRRGFNLSLGVLNKFDLDWETGQKQKIDIVEEQPFSPISEETFAQNLEVMEKADKLILADVPIGNGNLKNLEALLLIQEKGKEILIINETSFEKRDFTNGEGKRLLELLVSKGAKLITKQELWSSLYVNYQSKSANFLTLNW